MTEERQGELRPLWGTNRLVATGCSAPIHAAVSARPPFHSQGLLL
jgi:hypothetical protein